MKSLAALALGLCILSSALATAKAETVLQVENGILVGADAVNVAGVLYDVRFVDGTCAAVFGSCEQSSFAFTTGEEAQAASQALMDQVFTPAFAYYDDNPSKTYGCGRIDLCVMLTPFGITTDSYSEYIVVSYAHNSDGTYNDYASGPNARFSIGTDYRNNNDFVFAVWTQSAPALVELSPGATDFGRVVISGSKTLRVTVSNIGAESVSLISVAESDQLAPPFSITQDMCSGTVISPTESCEFYITFSPSELGEYIDSFDVISSDPIAPSIRATVRGVAVVLGGQAIGLRELSVTCENKTQKAKVTFPVSTYEMGAWDCQVAGLPVNSGDEVTMKAKGVAE